LRIVCRTKKNAVVRNKLTKLEKDFVNICICGDAVVFYAVRNPVSWITSDRMTVESFKGAQNAKRSLARVFTYDYISDELEYTDISRAEKNCLFKGVRFAGSIYYPM